MDKFNQVIKKCFYSWSTECIKFGTAADFPKGRMCTKCIVEKNRRFYEENKAKLNLRERAKNKAKAGYQKVDYIDGKIYQLDNEVDSQIYIGSTCDIDRRMITHRHHSKVKPNQKVYKHLNFIGWDKVHITVLENYPCGNRKELEQRERYWVDKLKPTLNNNIPGRTDDENCSKQYHQKYMSSTKYKEYQKNYAKTPKSKEYQRKYQQTQSSKEYRKWYYTHKRMIVLIERYKQVKPVEIKLFKLE